MKKVLMACLLATGINATSEDVVALADVVESAVEIKSNIDDFLQYRFMISLKGVSASDEEKGVAFNIIQEALADLKDNLLRDCAVAINVANLELIDNVEQSLTEGSVVPFAHIKAIDLLLTIDFGTIDFAQKNILLNQVQDIFSALAKKIQDVSSSFEGTISGEPVIVSEETKTVTEDVNAVVVTEEVVDQVVAVPEEVIA